VRFGKDTVIVYRDRVYRLDGSYADGLSRRVLVIDRSEIPEEEKRKREVFYLEDLLRDGGLERRLYTFVTVDGVIVILWEDGLYSENLFPEYELPNIRRYAGEPVEIRETTIDTVIPRRRRRILDFLRNPDIGELGLDKRVVYTVTGIVLFAAFFSLVVARGFRDSAEVQLAEKKRQARVFAREIDEQIVLKAGAILRSLNPVRLPDGLARMLYDTGFGIKGYVYEKRTLRFTVDPEVAEALRTRWHGRVEKKGDIYEVEVEIQT